MVTVYERGVLKRTQANGNGELEFLLEQAKFILEEDMELDDEDIKVLKDELFDDENDFENAVDAVEEEPVRGMGKGGMGMGKGKRGKVVDGITKYKEARIERLYDEQLGEDTSVARDLAALEVALTLVLPSQKRLRGILEDLVFDKKSQNESYFGTD